MPVPEAQVTVDGVIPEDETRTRPLVNGDVTMEATTPIQEQAMISLPPLYDMDLERMHIDLYRDKYLTPQEFLEDIHKIVHNAAVRQHEDLDRLYKAQAMLTATEVSIHDFDPQLKLECERMSAREKQRREESKKAKEKGKPTEITAAPGIRRSARNNGQQPELGITDPLKLERKLKRQRAGELAGDSLGSEEEHSDGRTAKRSKMGSEDEGDHDSPALGELLSVPRPVGVRFAVDEIEPMAPLQGHGDEN